MFGLEKRVRELELALYHERLPPLRKVMKRVNTELVHCACLQCQREGRWPCKGVIGAAWPGEGCLFLPLWQAYLRDLGVGVDVVEGRHLAAFRASSDLGGKFSTSPAPVWTASHVWTEPAHWLCDYGWGRPLSSLDSPRRALWDAVAACDYRLDVSVFAAGGELDDEELPDPPPEAVPAPAALHDAVALMTLG